MLGYVCALAVRRRRTEARMSWDTKHRRTGHDTGKVRLLAASLVVPVCGGGGVGVRKSVKSLERKGHDTSHFSFGEDLARRPLFANSATLLDVLLPQTTSLTPSHHHRHPYNRRARPLCPRQRAAPVPAWRSQDHHQHGSLRWRKPKGRKPARHPPPRRRPIVRTARARTEVQRQPLLSRQWPAACFSWLGHALLLRRRG